MRVSSTRYNAHCFYIKEQRQTPLTSSGLIESRRDRGAGLSAPDDYISLQVPRQGSLNAYGPSFIVAATGRCSVHPCAIIQCQPFEAGDGRQDALKNDRPSTWSIHLGNVMPHDDALLAGFLVGNRAHNALIYDWERSEG